MNWLAPVTPSQLGEGITFKIRHTPEFHKGSLTPHPSPKGEGNHDSFTIVSEEPIHGVAPGQFCVIYDAEHHYCFGSGEITI